MYENYNLINVIKYFILHYNTKGNMKLLNESFQRQLIVKNFKQWIIVNINAFIKPTFIRSLPTVSSEDDTLNKEILNISD